MKDSAGKFCPDKWTRQEEEGRVEGTGHEEVPHEEEKEDHDVTARSPARTHSRADQPNRSREFSPSEPWPCSCEMRWARSVSQTRTSRRRALRDWRWSPPRDAQRAGAPHQRRKVSVSEDIRVVGGFRSCNGR